MGDSLKRHRQASCASARCALYALYALYALPDDVREPGLLILATNLRLSPRAASVLRPLPQIASKEACLEQERSRARELERVLDASVKEKFSVREALTETKTELVMVKETLVKAQVFEGIIELV